MNDRRKKSGFGGGSVQEACQPAPQARPASDEVDRRRLAQRARLARQERESVAVLALARRRSSCKRCGSTVAVMRVMHVVVQPDGFEVRSQVRLCRACRQLTLPGFPWPKPTTDRSRP